MDRALRKEIEYFFYNYTRLKRIIEERMTDVAERVTINYGKTPIKAQKQNGYESAVIKALAESEETKKWLNVVEQTIEYFSGTEKEEFIRSKFFLRRNELQLCEKYYIERRAILRWVNEILTYAAMVALQDGLIKVY